MAYVVAAYIVDCLEELGHNYIGRDCIGHNKLSALKNSATFIVSLSSPRASAAQVINR